VSFVVLSEEDEPKCACKENDDAWIKQRKRSDFRFRVVTQEKIAHQKAERDCHCQAEHPDRKKGTDYVDGRRTLTPGACHGQSHSETTTQLPPAGSHLFPSSDCSFVAGG
jgi:hypothetical protein